MIFKYFDGSNPLHYSFNEDLLGFSCKRCGAQTQEAMTSSVEMEATNYLTSDESKLKRCTN